MNQVQNNYRIRINHYIKVPQVRVLDSEGNLIGVMATSDALRSAKDQGLDLIEINPKSNPPVCKIADYGKYKYDEKKKASVVKKNQKISELKELTIRPSIDDGDLRHKVAAARSFLVDGDKVKLIVRFRGREITHPQVGVDKINAMITSLNDVVGSNAGFVNEGRTISVVLNPKSNKDKN